MKSILLAALMAFMVTAYAQTGTISAEEHKFITDYLKRSEADLSKLISSMDERLWSKKPSLEVWSPAECMEHVLLAESGLMKQIKTALNETADDDDLRSNDAWLISKISDRGVKVKTPLEPQEGSISQKEALNKLKASRKEILDFLQDESLELRTHYGSSPYGKADVYQLFIVIAAHSMRHTAQMQEILTALKS